MSILGLGLPFLLALQDPPVRELVDRLQTPSAAERSHAFDRLRSLGRSAESELRRGAEDSDPELAARSRVLLRSLELRERLPRTLLQVFADLDVRLAQNAPEWTLALGEATRRNECGDRVHPELGWTELDALATEALRNAPHPEDQRTVCSIIGEYGLSSALPELHALLEDPDLESRRAALRALFRIRSPASIVPIARHLEDPDLRNEAGSFLANYGRASVFPVLETYVRHPCRDVRAALVELLRGVADENAFPLLSRLAQDSDPLIRARALLAAGPLRGRLSAETLIGFLLHDPGPLRGPAHEALRGTRTPERFQELRRLLASPEPEVRSQAAHLLGEFRDESAFSDLLDLLDDPDSEVRCAGITALYQLRSRQAIPKFTGLLTDPSERVRSLSSRILSLLGLPEAQEIYLQRLREGSDADRLETLRGLSPFSVPEAAADLARLAQTAQGELRLEALRMLGTPEAQAQAPLLIPFLASTEESVAERAEAALASMGAKAVIPKLTELLSHPESYVRQRALSLLTQMRVQEAGPHVLRLLDDADPSVRLEAIRSLEAIPVRAAIPRLRAFLGGREPELKLAAVATLASFKATEAVDDIAALLDDDVLQSDVIQSLWILGSRRAVPALGRLLDAPQSPCRTRTAALQVMLCLDGPETVEALRRIARSPGHPMRESAIRGLATISAWESVSDLLPCLHDRSLLVQDAAADALAQLGVREAVPALRTLLQEDKAGRRTALLLALARLGATETAPRILELLHHEDAEVVASAIQSAQRLRLREALPALLGLSRGDDHALRPLAAGALARLGDPSEVPRLLEGDAHELFLLNRLRRPELWERLESLPRTRAHPQDPPPAWAELACDAGLEISLELDPDYEDWVDRRRRDSCQGGVTTLLEELEELIDGRFYCTVILEDDRIRVLPTSAARQLLKEWWRQAPGR
ncbi:MAG TPA: HEAT repeat domain-containing protein [Planctomycetota bacterium]|nr:HEAT repeat domain-containing protein [Planctomycetota bacterium]